MVNFNMWICLSPKVHLLFSHVHIYVLDKHIYMYIICSLPCTILVIWNTRKHYWLEIYNVVEIRLNGVLQYNMISIIIKVPILERLSSSEHKTNLYNIKLWILFIFDTCFLKQTKPKSIDSCIYFWVFCLNYKICI